MMDTFETWLVNRINHINETELINDNLVCKVLKITEAFTNEDVADLVKFCNLIVKLACLNTLELVLVAYKRSRNE